MNEQVLTFGENKELIGISTLANITPPDFSKTGLMFINAGLVHRVGQNRLYVKISRELAKIGFSTFRFDLSGVGDSSINLFNSDEVDRTVEEISMAIDVFINTTGVTDVTLIGACSGAINALHCCQDPRVKNLILINPSSPKSFRLLARRHLLNWKSWFRLLQGSVNLFTVAKKLRNNRKKVEKISSKGINHVMHLIDYTKVIKALNNKNNILFVCSQWDPSLDNCMAILRKINETDTYDYNIYTKVIVNSDHSLFGLKHQEQIISTIRNSLVNWSSGKDHKNDYRKTFSFFRNI